MRCPPGPAGLGHLPEAGLCSRLGLSCRALRSCTAPGWTPDSCCRPALIPAALCRYKDYREPPWSEHKYDISKDFWAVLAARLAFVIVFQVRQVLVSQNTVRKAGAGWHRGSVPGAPQGGGLTAQVRSQRTPRVSGGGGRPAGEGRLSSVPEVLMEGDVEGTSVSPLHRSLCSRRHPRAGWGVPVVSSLPPGWQPLSRRGGGMGQSHSQGIVPDWGPGWNPQA